MLCTQLIPFKTIWANFVILYPIDYFQCHITSFLYCVPNWLLLRPFAPILSLCTQLTPFKTIWPNFIIVYPVDSFQDHMISISLKITALFTENHCAFHWKATKTADSTQISYFDLVFCRVQREGQLDISYILVVFGGVCGAYMCKWYMYTHILTWFCLFSWKVALLYEKWCTFYEKHMKSNEKHLENSWINTGLSFWPGLS